MAMRQQEKVGGRVSLMHDYFIGGESSLFGSSQNRRKVFCTEPVEQPG
jgi:hypothetical protein